MKIARTAILAGLVAALLASSALAQGRTPPSQEQLKENRANKVAEKWFTDAGWIDDYDVAREKASESGKLILAYFTRTYAN
jgi:hypothetical protein